MAALGPGRIFWAVYPGQRGGGKLRPMVIVTSLKDILSTKQLLAVVCTTVFASPPPENEVVLPHREDGMGITALKQPTVAVCDWTTPFAVADISETGGQVPPTLLREICRKAGIRLAPER